jgi:DNA-3-methyladenine glycosylase II
VNRHRQHLRAAVRHLRRADPVMRRLIDRVGPCRLELRSDRFLALARAIIFQQISGRAAQTIFSRVEAAAAPAGITPQAIATLTPEQMRAAGLSAPKAKYLASLARLALDGTLRLEDLAARPDHEVIEHLVQAPGIGEWTAQMFLIFSLGRPDVLPLDDLGVRVAIRNLYGFKSVPSKRTCERIARPWRPYASVASWYCWRSHELKD